MRVLVTGGAGFIGSALARRLIDKTHHEVIVVDKLTYAATLASLESVSRNPRYSFAQLDICETAPLQDVFHDFDPDIVIHLAAESHVDRSIEAPAEFIRTNVFGTYSMLQAALRHWQALAPRRRESFRFHHVSTDEVYGSLGDMGHFTEKTAYDPRSPYSASKASADHLVKAWYHTFGLPVVVSNCSNNYGPFQFPEKLIPLMIIKAIAGDNLPVYGSGHNIRDWLYVGDHAGALQSIFERGMPGETYNIGGSAERRNIDVVRSLCGILDTLRPRQDGLSYARQITFVADRPGHDHRYAIDSGKIQSLLGWKPEESFETGIRRTVQWYLDNESWWQNILKCNYSSNRLGLIHGTRS